MRMSVGHNGPVRGGQAGQGAISVMNTGRVHYEVVVAAGLPFARSWPCESRRDESPELALA